MVPASPPGKSKKLRIQSVFQKYIFKSFRTANVHRVSKHGPMAAGSSSSSSFLGGVSGADAKSPPLSIATPEITQPKAKAKSKSKAKNAAAIPKLNMGIQQTPNSTEAGQKKTVIKAAAKGRPKKSRISMAEDITCRIEQANDSADPIWANLKVYSQRAYKVYGEIHAEIDGMLAEEVSAEVVGQYRVASKRLYCTHMILKSLEEHGSYTDRLAEAITECELYLSLEPKCEFSFPSFMLQQRHELSLMGMPLDRFWEHLDKEALEKAGFLVYADGLETLCNVKISNLSRLESDFLPYAGHLKMMFRADRYSSIVPEDMVGIRAEFEHIWKIGQYVDNCEQVPFEVEALTAVQTAAQEETNKILRHAIETKNGKLVMKQFDAYVIRQKKKQLCLCDIDGKFTPLREAVATMDTVTFRPAHIYGPLVAFVSACNESITGAVSVNELLGEEKAKQLDASLLKVYKMIEQAEFEGMLDPEMIAVLEQLAATDQYMNGGLSCGKSAAELKLFLEAIVGLRKRVADDGDDVSYDTKEAASVLAMMANVHCEKKETCPDDLKKKLDDGIANLGDEELSVKMIEVLEKPFKEQITVTMEQLATLKSIIAKGDITSTAVLEQLGNMTFEGIAAVRQNCSNTCDAVFIGRVRFLERLQKACTAMARLMTENASDSDKTITREKVDKLECLRTLVKVLVEATDYGETLEFLFAAKDHRLRLFADSIDAKQTSAAFYKATSVFAGQVVQHWVDDQKKLSKSLKQGTPDGWLPLRLLDEDDQAKQMREKLWSNPEYTKLGGMIQVYTSASRLLKPLRCDFSDHITVDLLDDKITTAAADCVAFTFLSYVLKTKAPGLKSLQIRKTTIDDALASAGKKVKAPPQYAEYAKQLKEGSDPMATEVAP